MLTLKQIVIDENHNFGTVFNKDPNDETKKVVIPSQVSRIGDSDFVEALQDIYNYFVRNRHVIFHVDQILINTKVIEDKHEAVTIINDVAALIESTYKNGEKVVV